jgi:hypothetical protein
MEGPGNFSNRIRSIRARKQEQEIILCSKEAQEDAKALKRIADKLEASNGYRVSWGGRWTMAIQTQLNLNGCDYERIDDSEVQIWIK